jgi:CrcB protein
MTDPLPPARDAHLAGAGADRPAAEAIGWDGNEAEAIAEAELPHAPADRAAPAATPLRERMATVAAVSAGGMLGANARYLVGRWAVALWATTFPWGTLVINISGSFVLGFYLTLVTERFTGRATTRLFVATGFLGAYTTFSTFGYDTAHLIQTSHYWQAGLNVVASLVVGMLGVVAGIAAANSP